MNADTIRERIKSHLLDNNEEYEIDDFIKRAEKLKSLGYLSVEIETSEYYVEIYGTRLKTEEEKAKELKSLEENAARFKEQRRQQYLKLHEEFAGTNYP